MSTHVRSSMYLKIWKMERCSIFHNIFKSIQSFTYSFLDFFCLGPVFLFAMSDDIHRYQCNIPFIIWLLIYHAFGELLRVKSIPHNSIPINKLEDKYDVVLFVLLLYIPVNGYGHVEMVSSPNNTFFLATSTLCTYFRL